MNRKRICFFLPYHYSALMGGSEYQAKLILDALQNQNEYDIHYVCTNVDPGFVPHGYTIWQVGNQNRPGKIGLYLDALPLYKVLKKIRPEIIYQRVGGVYTGIAALYAKRYGAKFIWHVSSDNSIEPYSDDEFKRRVINAPERLFINYGIKNADIIVAQTHYQKNLLEHRYCRKNIILIPNGHPCPEDNFRKPDTLSVLWINNLKPLKQPQIFVRLAKDLQNCKDVNFIMIGAPGVGQWFNKLVAEIKEISNLNYIRELPQYQVNQFLNCGHILVNTSKYEGFPNTFIQAWMRRLPVVSLNVDPDNILVRFRIGFRSQAYSRLRHDVQLLLAHAELRQEMGSRARRFSERNFSVETMLAKVSDLFKDM